MGFSRQEYWSGLPLPSPGVLPYMFMGSLFWEFQDFFFFFLNRPEGSLMNKDIRNLWSRDWVSHDPVTSIPGDLDKSFDLPDTDFIHHNNEDMILSSQSKPDYFSGDWRERSIWDWLATSPKTSYKSEDWWEAVKLGSRLFLALSHLWEFLA